MRDPARIKRVLARIEAFWTRHPDLRLGQLLCNHHPAFEDDPYNTEDDALEAALQGYQVPKAEVAHQVCKACGAEDCDVCHAHDQPACRHGLCDECAAVCHACEEENE